MNRTVRLTRDDDHVLIASTRGTVRLHRRNLAVVTGIGTLVLTLALVALTLGDYPLSFAEVVSALVSDQGFITTIVTEWRLPRVLSAIAFGAALGASGALFQTLTRNPLGSPDIIGFATGSYTGAIISITVLGGGAAGVMGGAMIGGLATAVVVYALAWRGGVQGFRLIIVGIAVTAVLNSLNTYLLLRAQSEVAMTASIWGAGSLALTDWGDIAVALGPLVLLGAATAVTLPGLRQLELGDDAARAHGVHTEAIRVSVLVLGVALIAIVTAICGPIAFIALAAPQIARRLTRTAGIPVLAASFTGALLLLSADLIAQHVVAGSVPVGMVTVVVGGVYLIALIIQEARRQL
ncbi:iron chelate uptake ABC transporter family permease subunit [uncultured Aeromicrobium sp.]|uniref:FecCD family ABC transporter permease n=1 Tax=uncultured Aeromicrobium sp. TaxID=337820 RepID=UPI0025E97776|nr:iron chelate uptake ABC transporter family permease subunit [uncultured Aeromicrobium sp.]